MRRRMLGPLVLLAVVAVAPAHASEAIVLTSGRVTAIDPAAGVVVLDSGVQLRVRRVIVNDQAASLDAVRVDDTVFVSGVELKGADQSGTRATERR